MAYYYSNPYGCPPPFPVYPAAPCYGGGIWYGLIIVLLILLLVFGGWWNYGVDC
ncbi:MULTISPECIES: hypothetical protein [unclassified Bacillus (in: firmicutes)]|uniref:hypothetical protein n=1 Tax=unclassified Bacillus (in: firmicutes) TaxID=185979 RepID=UPI0008E929A6|nr:MULTISPECIES: hypothetical protein [unclassified Bacillus (in: firmicutes)]SFA95189.1 hypothetical protein SAMN02799634_10361 [Bacillus sp. UNCCL13]SFQ78944.1 hypothetical protein SAMN04488577_1695 [Bacillus sp. cl95]